MDQARTTAGTADANDIYANPPDPDENTACFQLKHQCLSRKVR